jgi:thiamine biosynthesis lipoprotein
MILNIMILTALASGAAAAPPEAAPVERARFAMGTVCRIAASHDEPGAVPRLVESAFAEIARWETILSDYDPASELSALNREASRRAVACSADLFAFLEAAAGLAAETGGAFDPTVGPLVDLYALRRGGRLPSPREIQDALGSVGHRRLILDRASRTARFAAPGMRLDPGAMGKGFALDAAARVLREGGVRWALLDFGGQILAVGGGPGGCGFPVEVAAGGRASGRRIAIRLRDASAATSGNDERGAVVDGAPVGHLLDPRTGLPAAGLASVTAVHASGARADALSTALFVAGFEEGPAAAEALGAAALFVRDGGSGIEARATAAFERLENTTCSGEGTASPGPSR